MDEGTAYRRYCHVCWYGGRCWRFALTGSFESATNWAGVLGTGIIAFLVGQWGKQIMPAESWVEIIAQGLLYIVAAWVVIFFFRLFFVAPFRIHGEGAWHDTTFVYNEPKLGFHLYARPQKNNVVSYFRFPDAPPFSLVNYKLEFDTPYPREFITATVASHQNQLRTFGTHKDLFYIKGSTRVDKRRNMCMTTFMREDTNPVSVRVYVTGWDIGPGDPPPPKTEPQPVDWATAMAARVFS